MPLTVQAEVAVQKKVGTGDNVCGQHREAYTQLQVIMHRDFVATCT